MKCWILYSCLVISLQTISAGYKYHMDHMAENLVLGIKSDGISSKI